MHSLFLFFKRYDLPSNILENKDPNDFTLTASSTGWKTHPYYCLDCKSDTSHNEFIAHICNHCGSFRRQELNYKVTRQIYYNNKWITQTKLRSGEIFLETD